MRTLALHRVLLVHPDTVVVARLKNALMRAGYDVRTAPDASTGLRTLAATEPEILIVAIDIPERDGAWLLRRMRDDYMGKRPHVIAVGSADAAMARLTGLVTSAVILEPVATDLVLAAVAELTEAVDHPGDRDNLAKLLTLTLLEGDIDESFRAATERTCLAYRVADCVVVATIGEREHIVSASQHNRPPNDPFWNSCLVALQVGAPVLEGTDADHVTTFFSVPMQLPGSPRVGVIVLSDPRARVFAPHSLGWLRAIAQRFYTELTWRAVHERIAADRDRLRESSMLDPMLGIWTRDALEQALPGEVASARRRQEQLALAVLDIRGLRHVNDLLGHNAGDAVIRHVSGLIGKNLRPNDIVARYARNTFAAVLNVGEFDEALRLIRGVQEAIATTELDYEGQIITTEVIAGVAALLGAEDSGEAALRRAMAALTSAKRKSRHLAVADAVTPATDLFDEAPYTGLEAGTTLGGMYQILHEISRGAMGVVYRAEDLGLGRQVALKTLRPDLVRDRSLVELFRHEATTLAKLRHENLVQVYTFGIYDDNAYFVMELVEGEPLEELIEREWRADRHVPLSLVDSIVAQIASALDLLHQAGVIHRDVKPANVLLDRARDRAVLVDFGIAKPAGVNLDAAGTPGYAAPEIFRGAPDQPAVDVYGLAATSYILLTCTPPFDEGSVPATLARQAGGPPEPASRARPGLPAAVDQVLDRALSPDPAQRHRSASSFARELITALAGAPAELRAGADSVGDTIPRPGIESTQPAAARAARPGSEPSAPPRRKRVSTLVGVPVREFDEEDEPPLTRGALFRAAYRVLDKDGTEITVASPKNATLVRAGWVSKVAVRSGALAEALGPQGSNLSWHPTDAFVTMLQFMADDGRDALAFARELGRIAASSTFGRFFGADPAALPTAEVLRAADVFWQSYHSWGKVLVTPAGDHAVDVIISQGPGSELLCASTCGLLEQVATLAGARDTEVSHPVCEAENAPACVFEVRWGEPQE